MTKKLSKKIWIFITFIVLNVIIFPFYTFAKDGKVEVDGFNILPELSEKEITEVNQEITKIWQTWWNVWAAYTKAASGMSTSQQIASWIMNRDTIMNYLVFVVQFLSQLWLVVWTWFIIYAWYKYMLSVFNGWKVPSETVKNAIIWVIIIIFSYAIMKTLTSLIWIS